MKEKSESFNFFNARCPKNGISPVHFDTEEIPYYIIRTRARRLCGLVEDVAVVLHVGALEELLHET